MEIAHLKDHLQHVPELARLHGEEWGWLRPDEGEEERIARIHDICSAPDMPVLLIALDAGTLVGSAGLKAKDGLLPDLDLTPWLFAVYVKKAYRSLGIAAKLIAEVESIARHLHFPVLHLCTHKHAAYYERLGYRTLQQGVLGDEPTFVMAKSLA
jgi:GNAT superfamily N-acetyltransferase